MIGRIASRFGFVVAAVAAVLVGTALLSGATAHAQNPPATYYGVAASGDVVTAVIDGTTCETATANAAGEWVISLPDGSCDGKATTGAAVSFTLNGAAAADAAQPAVTWEPGGAPDNLVTGLTLVATGGGVTPPDTGNAGFALDEGGVSPWLALSLGLFALAAVAGVRMASRRVR